jgi:hypothetical protein
MNVLFNSIVALTCMVCMANSSCNEDEVGRIKTASFNSAFELETDEKAILSAGQKEMMVWLSSINDSRCHPNVQCIWAGNVKAELRLSASDGSEVVVNMCLGQCDHLLKTIDSAMVNVNNRNYTIILSDVTLTGRSRAVLLVKRN